LKRVPSTESRRRSFLRETAVNLLLVVVVLLGVIVVVAGTMFVTGAVFYLGDYLWTWVFGVNP
jgi:hypothetical protein